MPTFHSGDAQLFYEVTGSGPDVVLLHPFPLDHTFWEGVVPALSSRYRVVAPDLRAHGASELGEGRVTMQNLCADLVQLCREERIERAVFVGVSIGGYALFEFWRQHRERVRALVLSNTRAAAESPQSRTTRMATVVTIEKEGPEGFINSMLAGQLSKATQANRPDIVDRARRMMQRMSPEDIVAVQYGIADRPDSIATLSTINVPTLVVGGEDDSVPRPELELMHQHIAGSELKIIPSAGHYAALERPEEYGMLLRRFLDRLP